MSECTHNCSTCSQNCSSRKDPESLHEQPHELSKIKKVIGVVSGKGGVGKSLVTSLLAVSTQRKGFKTAILDADITGPSIPKAFGIKEKAQGTENGILPCKSKTGIEIMSVNLLLENDTDPVVWRGPVIAGAVKQFWQDVVWGDLDYLFIDCPPGTGDVPLTVFQTIPLDGIVMVTSPQDLVSLIVKKAYNMAKMMNINILGLVENMSYVKCPDCGKQFSVFGGGSDDIAKELDIDLLGKLPIDISLTQMVDNGCIEHFNEDYLNNAVAKLEKLNK